jgi:peroxiredoxin
MTEHMIPFRIGFIMRRIAATVFLIFAMAAWTGCSKDSTAPPGQSSSVPATGSATDETPPAENGDSTAAPVIGSEEPSSENEIASAPPPEEGAAPDDGAGDAVAPPVDKPPGENGAPKAFSSGIAQPPRPTQVFKPEVILSQYHAQTCVVGIGDQFPQLALPDLDGNVRELPQLYGDRMTIVIFWSATGFYAREQFSRIMYECQERYAALGVSVVAINVGDSPEVVQELAAKHGVAVPCLLDTDSSAFRQAATDLLPRTYLLDAGGRIVWFELEYSRSQRLELHNAVYCHLKQNGA